MTVEREGLRLLTERMPALLWTADAELRFTSARGAGLAALGLRAGEIEGKPIHELGDASLTAAHRRALEGETVSCEGLLRGRMLDAHVEPLRDGHGAVAGCIAVALDVTEQHRARELLAHQALHDRLTELPNRAAFLARLGEQVRSRCGDHFALLAIDLDRFKVINGSLGQVAGDQLLASVAQRISACLGDGDSAARLGSDEFAVLLCETASSTDSLRLAERLRQAIGEPLEIRAQEIFPSASIGVVCGESYHDAEELLRDAQIAMSRAKSLGGGRCEIFDPDLGSRTLGRLRLENELRRAIEHGELRMYYQPITRLSDGAIVAFEALLRWPRGDGSMIPPAEIISVAEESGLILPLSYWTLGEVCDRLCEWGERGLAVHLNVSGRLFADPELVDRLRAALAEARVGGERLVLEVTESVLMENLDLAAETLLHIKALGIGVAIDDFGTGYSSLSYLQRFPVDCLKIDRSFVSKLGERGETPEILRAVLNLARSLEVEVIAEGVETERQLVHLLALGCGLAQGYLFSSAVERDAARSLLAGTPDWARPLPFSALRRLAVPEERSGIERLRRAAAS
jgi:diguanylate cyclase (GGDEF)-like protein/PAS domain S-box-containing protein